MSFVLFDSSVWINSFKSLVTDETILLKEYLSTSNNTAICPPIVQELFQGCKEADLPKIKSIEQFVYRLSIDPYEVAEEAAAIYRSLKQNGYTINKPNDCIIAYYAINFGVPLAHNDKDFNTIAKHTKLKIWHRRK